MEPVSQTPQNLPDSPARSGVSLEANKKVALVIVGILVLASLGYLAYKQFGDAGAPFGVLEDATLVPEGFPSDIPLEEENIISSGSNSNDAGINFKVKYRTDSPLAVKYDEYVSTLQESGYKINPGKQELSKDLILASRNFEIVSVAFYVNNQMNIVDINYSNLSIVDESSI